MSLLSVIYSCRSVTFLGFCCLQLLGVVYRANCYVEPAQLSGVKPRWTGSSGYLEPLTYLNSAAHRFAKIVMGKFQNPPQRDDDLSYSQCALHTIISTKCIRRISCTDVFSKNLKSILFKICSFYLSDVRTFFVGLSRPICLPVWRPCYVCLIYGALILTWLVG